MTVTLLKSEIGDEGSTTGGALTQEQMQKQQQEREASKREKRDEKDWKPVD